MSFRLPLAITIVSFACLAHLPGAAAATDIAGKRLLQVSERTAPASSLIATPAACPGQNSLTASVEAQEEAMRCMTDFARTNAGLAELAAAEELDHSARDKAEDILRCDSFSHFACGREFTYWMRETGYIGEQCWHAGENLAWGTGEYGSVRAIFRAWMNSPDHRKNILGAYDQIGISLVTGDLEGHAAAHVWAAHFGSRCEG
jgi:uncharacterized protein YkwD